MNNGIKLASILQKIIIAGLLLSIMQMGLPGVASLYWLNTFLLAFIGVLTTSACICLPNEMSAGSMLGGAFSSAYGIGTLYTELTVIKSKYDIIKFSYTTPTEISTAIAIVLFTSCLLILIGLKIKRPILPREELENIPPKTSIIIAGATLGITIFLIAIGKIGFNYNIQSEDGGISVLGQLALTSLCPTIGLIAFNASRFSKKHTLLAILFASTILLIQLIMGRRIFAFTLFTGFACYCAGHSFKEVLTKRNIAIALISFACLGVASKFFVAMREASRELPTTAKIADIIKDAVDIIRNSDRTDISATATENERERTFIIGYLSELMEKSEEIPPLYGEVTKFSLATVVPSFLWRDKMKYMSLGFEEAIIHPHFRLPIWDGANSLFTSGLSDFGLPGCVGFPIFFGIIYSYIPSLLRRANNGIVLAPLHIGFFYTLLGVEAATSSYLVAIRDLFLICVIFSLFIKLLSKWEART